MKYPIILILLFLSFQSKEQTLTLSRLSTVVRDNIVKDSVKIAALQYKLDLKDIRDSVRNVKIDLLFWENAQLKKSNDSIKFQNESFKRIFDNAVISLDSTQFSVDPITKIATYIDKPDTFIINKKSPRVPKTLSLISGELVTERKPYTLTFPLEEDAEEIHGLKAEIKAIKKSLSSREKRIATLEKTIDKQKGTIDKLKKQ